MKIINHPSIIDCTHVTLRNGEHPNRIVLRKVDDNYMPYAIHHENMKINGDNVEHMDFYLGRYFFDLETATNEFNRSSQGAGRSFR